MIKHQCLVIVFIFSVYYLNQCPTFSRNCSIGYAVIMKKMIRLSVKLNIAIV